MHQSVLDLDQHRRDLAPSFERLELVEKDKCMNIFKLMFTHEDVSWNIWFIMHTMFVNTCMWKLPVLRICVCVCRMCGLSFYVVTCSFIWLAPNMHDMHFWWQLPAPWRRRRLWGPSRISNGWMEQLGRTESWKRTKMIKPRSHFKRIVSWIEIFLFATAHLDTKTFLTF